MAGNGGSQIHGVIFASLTREQVWQSQSCYASKTGHQREADAWNAYLALWRTFRACLGLPQVAWLLCENGSTRVLDVGATGRFLDQAQNVLGWKYSDE